MQIFPEGLLTVDGHRLRVPAALQRWSAMGYDFWGFFHVSLILTASGTMQFWSSYKKNMFPVLYQSCFIIVEDGTSRNAKVDYLYDPHTHRLWCRPFSHAIVTATHRQPLFLAASQSAASRLTSFLIVGLRRDIVTPRPDVQFCSLDTVPCHSHSSLAVVLSLKVVSTRLLILLFPPLPSLCRHDFAISTSVAFRRLSTTTLWARL